MAEFMCSLRLVFPNVVDINYLLREINPLRKANNMPAAMSYLRRQFFVPIEMEIPEQGTSLPECGNFFQIKFSSHEMLC